MRGLDDYIMGIHIHEEDNAVPHKCDKCGKAATFPMFFELGGWFYTAEAEDSLGCECGGEYQIV